MKEEYSNQYRRWYDKDPVLSEAVKTLEETDDQTQIRVALNLIKIIIEHNIEDEKFEAVEKIPALDFVHQNNMDDWLILDKIEDVIMGSSIPFDYKKSKF